MDNNQSEIFAAAEDERPSAPLSPEQLRVFYHPGPHPAPESLEDEDGDPVVIELPADLDYVDNFLRQRLSLPPRNFDRPLFIMPSELHTFVDSPLIPDPSVLLANAQAAAAQADALAQDETDIAEWDRLENEAVSSSTEEGTDEEAGMFDWLSEESPREGE